jgi:hypothetical protein
MTKRSDEEILALFSRANLATDPIPTDLAGRARELALLAAALDALKRRGGDLALEGKIRRRVLAIARSL